MTSSTFPFRRTDICPVHTGVRCTGWCTDRVWCHWRFVSRYQHCDRTLHIYLSKKWKHRINQESNQESIQIVFPSCRNISCCRSLYWHWSPWYSGGQLQVGWLPMLTEQLPPFRQWSWQVWRLQVDPVKPFGHLQVGTPGTTDMNHWLYVKIEII